MMLRPEELIVDNFAGGGGTSEGIEEFFRSIGLDRHVDIAINHDPEAIAMHTVNHPRTLHLCENVWNVDILAVTKGRPVGLAWFSPDCKHFSKAKGGKPVSQKIRGLAWVVVRWAEAKRPRIIVVENVEEFQDWGPLLEDNRPDPDRLGVTFRRWLGRLRNLGYRIHFGELMACRYGARTSRKRLVIVARCDGRDPAELWPEPTHGPGLLPYGTAAECIDFSLPCPSIFLSKDEGRAIGVKRPLAEATMRRIARGVKRYVIDAAEPFIVNLTHQGSGTRTQGLHEPLRTVTGARRGEKALVVPTLVQTGYGERGGQAPRVPGLDKPLGTVVAGAGKHALVATFLAQHNAGFYEGAGRRVDQPLSTICLSGSHQSLVTSHIMKLRGTNIGSAATEPLQTVSASGTHHAGVRAFLMKYYGVDQDPRLDEPMHTIPTRDRFALVMVHGEPYAIVDIGMRMLMPRELFRAQGFPDSYIINGRGLSKTAQIKMCGNSVCPQMAEAVVRAQFTDDYGEAVA